MAARAELPWQIEDVGSRLSYTNQNAWSEMLSRFFSRWLGRLGPDGRRRWLALWAVLRPAGYLFMLLSLWSFVQVSLLRVLDWPIVFWLWPWLNAFSLFALADWFVGSEEAPAPAQRRVAAPTAWWESALRWLPLLALPAQAIVVVLGARLAATNPFMDWPERLAWMTSAGFCGGIHAGIAAHELIHRSTRWERLAGGLLLASVGYGSFKIEHVRGHHVAVATPADASSAPRGRSIYRFVPEAVVRNVIRAFGLEAERLRASGKSAWSPRNELLVWTAITAALAVALPIAYGPIALLFFAVQAGISIWILETANYIEHYGLRRQPRAGGGYEPVRAGHSWDVSYIPSAWMLFNLPKHAHHHLRASVPYYRLEPRPDAPKLPGGYSAMLLLAHLPPFWRRIIDPRIPADSAGAPAVTP
jgi:alkane 1-monooxygenase